MVNAQELLGVLMQGTLTASSPRRVEQALSTQGLGQPGDPTPQTGSGLAGLVALAQGLLGRMSPPAAPPGEPPPASTGLAALASAVFGGGPGATGGAAPWPS
jgi:hypothetical protein